MAKYEFDTQEELNTILASEDGKGFVGGLEGLKEKEYTSEAVNEYLGTDEGKKLLQPKLDSYHTKSLTSWQDKNLKDKYVTKEDYDKIVEERTTMQTENDNKMKELTLDSKIGSALLAGGLNAKFIDMVKGSISKEGLAVVSGKLVGATELVAGAKESFAELFGAVEGKKKHGVNNAGVNGDPLNDDNKDDSKQLRKWAGIS